jgi:anti-sigma factor RsiW
MNCRKIQSNMAALLLEPESVPADVRSHVETCAACSQELRELEATMNALDEWSAPEPSPYFDARMQALLREEKEAAPAGFFERVKTRLLFGSNMQLRPIAAAALALLIAIGGGTYAGFFMEGNHAQPAQASATVRDLQSLDGNEVVFQQLDSLDQPDDDSGSGSQNNL